MAIRCGYKTIDGLRLYLPQCWGGLYEKSGCYCSMPATIKDEIRDLESKIDDLQYELNATDITTRRQGTL